MSNANEKISVAIIGGGIGGVITALALLEMPQYDVRIYEASPAFAEIGAGMGFTPNALGCLMQINPSAHDLFTRIATPSLLNHRKEVWATYRYGEGDIGRDVAALPHADGQRTFHRARLLSGLAALLPPHIASFNKKYEGVSEGPDGLTVRFADGTTVMADCVLGTDGVHSHVRQYVLGESWPDYEPRFLGLDAYRALVPMEEAMAALGEDLAMTAYVHMGHGRGTVSYPIDFGRQLNLVAFDMNVKEDAGARALPADTKHLLALYEQWPEETRRLVKLLDRPGAMRWPVRELPALPTFQRGNVVLLGDSAHAMTPFHGAGAGMAVEDAFVLAAAMRQVRDKSQLGKALEAYEQVRRPRTQQVARSSHDIGEVMGLRMEGVSEDPKTIAEFVGRRTEAVWTYDVQADAEKASRIVSEAVNGAVHGANGVANGTAVASGTAVAVGQ